MRPSDQVFEQSVAPAMKTGTDTPVNETIAQFLATSALYFRLPAAQLVAFKHHNKLNLEIRGPL
jgi:hypothetical protein